jgi:hypothetical protein
MDSLITILILAAAALLSVFFKRKQAAGEETENWPRPREIGRTPDQPPEQRMSWEEELRRLLEGEPLKPTAPPPPIVVPETPRPAPRPVPTPRAPVGTPPPLPSRSLHSWRERPQHKPVALEGLRTSRSTYEQASRVDDKAKAQLKHASEQLRDHPKTVRIRSAPKSVHDAVSLFRSPQSARVALIASVVFGPPKGME